MRLGRIAVVSALGVGVISSPVAGGAAAHTPAAGADRAYARMTPAQRIGQLFMVGVPAGGITVSDSRALTKYHVGNAFLIGTTSAGVVAVATEVRTLRRTTTQARVAPYLAVDQEGGYVQHLSGPGFSRIPAALRQGRLAPHILRADWKRWAGQLRRTGLDVDFAPVADVVPADVGTRNQPIGRYDREYGHQPAPVGRHVVSVVRGARDAGVTTCVKHFPGLGRASGNTDTTSRVTDPTRRHDPYLVPFAGAIHAGVPMVMVSTAIYPHIDRGHVAAFSRRIVTGMLRHDLGFTGVIAVDSLQSDAVRRFTYAERAVRALQAGVDVLLLSDNTALRAMTAAIRSRIGRDATFAAVVHEAVRQVLIAKARAGLIAD